MESGSPVPALPPDGPAAPPATPSASSDRTRDALHVFYAVIFSATFLLGTAGNGLVIWVSGFRMTRTVNGVWYLHLAVADFAFCLFLPLAAAQAALGFHWPFGRPLCKVYNSLGGLNLFASVFLLTLISADRCVCVLRPVWAQRRRSPGRAALAGVGAWLLALALSVPQFLFRDTDGEGEHVHCYNNFDPWNETRGDEELRWELEKTRMVAVAVTRLVLGFVLPLVTIGACYALVLVQLARKGELRGTGRPLRVLVAVVSAFFLCWLPVHVASALQLVAYVRGSQALFAAVGVVGPLGVCLICVNSCLDPVLYAFLGQDFREHLLRSLPASLERALAEESDRTPLTGSSSGSGPPKLEIHHL
ncbi:N-formyl peptide receptor 2-like [Ornithorhynchus anatinus]|uniref:G-protein coupled receptors family 1 profile domain-containing protein n=1 Tax=Ornithorhynchus anatinus TaxID=9258 RepID=A0A6I8NY69_ORNAN|nr:N-formyl peptide receptor 2-like [Ornithorhynchus anatinus]